MEMQTCVVCHEEKHWRRFRKQICVGVMEETDVCSTCRNRLAAAARRKQEQFEKRVVLNRTRHEAGLQLGAKFYYPELEQQIRSYANHKTAMDRKYLRDHQDKPLSTRPHLAQKQLLAQQHAKGWVGLYDELADHAINLLRQTGTRPPWAQLEGKGDLHRLYGVYDTNRARLLRDRG